MIKKFSSCVWCLYLWRKCQSGEKMSRSLTPTQQKIAEKLTILNDRCTGILTRIYNIKKVKEWARKRERGVGCGWVGEAVNVCVFACWFVSGVWWVTLFDFTVHFIIALVLLHYFVLICVHFIFILLFVCPQPNLTYPVPNLHFGIS